MNEKNENNELIIQSSWCKRKYEKNENNELILQSSWCKNMNEKNENNELINLSSNVRSHFSHSDA